MAKAVDIIGERWTPLVLRELLQGSSRFNEIKRGVPLMSTALLSKRLKDLARAGVVDRVPVAGSRLHEYRLTPAGEELRPIIVALAVWGHKWVEDRLGRDDLDAGVLMWDIRRRIDTAALPAGRTVVRFEFPDAPKTMRLWWLVMEAGEVDLCQSDPGHEEDLFIRVDLHTMTEVWLGQLPFKTALRDGRIEAIGDRQLERTLTSWLRLSVFQEVAAAG